MRRSRELDMLNGPLFGKVWAFTLPLMLSGMLQLLYNAADMIVVGKAVGISALAAVGSTGSLSSLMVNLFMGLSVGASVVVAQNYGAGRLKDVNETVHTSMVVGLISGVIVGIVGFITCRPLLLLMGTPETVIDQAVLYVRIYFCGMPATSLYNFGAAILRAVGDTKRPMLFLVSSGLVNVVLNLFFVLVFRMGVAGVSLATVISQVIAAFLAIRCLMKADGCIQLYIRELRVYKDKLWNMIRIGLPAVVQSSLFSISNMLIQSSINFFGDMVIAANTAASNLDGFAYVALNSFSQTAITFTGQNVGADRWNRVKRVLGACAASVVITGAVIGSILMLAGRSLLYLYTSDAVAIEVGMVRFLWIAVPYFLCGLMDMMVGMMRGMGRSLTPMLVSLAGVCGIRIVWILTVFELHKQLWVVYASYPVTWLFTAAAHLICFAVVYRGEVKKWRLRTATA